MITSVRVLSSWDCSMALALTGDLGVCLGLAGGSLGLLSPWSPYWPASAAGPVHCEETLVQLSVTCYTLQTGRPGSEALPSDSPACSPARQRAVTLHLRLGAFVRTQLCAAAGYAGPCGPGSLSSVHTVLRWCAPRCVVFTEACS